MVCCALLYCVVTAANSHCSRRITNATALFSSLLGIRTAYAVGSPATEMVIEYDRTAGDTRTLSVKLNKEGRMTGAEVSCPPKSCRPSWSLKLRPLLLAAREFVRGYSGYRRSLSAQSRYAIPCAGSPCSCCQLIRSSLCVIVLFINCSYFHP